MQENVREYSFNSVQNPIIIKKKEIVLYDINDFVFDEYFQIISFKPYMYEYEATDDKIAVTINGFNYEFEYEIKEPEVIEMVFVKEVYIEKEDMEDTSEIEEESKEIIIEENGYFTGIHDRSYQKYTDISSIIFDIQNDIFTNEKVSIDYSALNPNAKGTYPIYFYVNEETYEIEIEIY